MNEKAESLPLEDVDADPDWEILDSRVSTAVPDIQSALEKALAATRVAHEQLSASLRVLSALVRRVESGLTEVRQQLEPPSDRPVPSAERNIRTGDQRLRLFEPVSTEPEAIEEPLVTAFEASEEEGGAETPEGTDATEAEVRATAGKPVPPSTMASKLLKQLMGGQH